MPDNRVVAPPKAAAPWQAPPAATAPPPPAPPAPAVQVLDERYKDMVCFTCGDPGHYVGNCIQAKICFICGLEGHNVNNCAAWTQPHPVATFFGSSALGLGFYHIDAPVGREANWVNFRNCGEVWVMKGEISKEDLIKNLSGIFCKTRQWSWQVRALSEKKFLVRSPPGRMLRN